MRPDSDQKPKPTRVAFAQQDPNTLQQPFVFRESNLKKMPDLEASISAGEAFAYHDSMLLKSQTFAIATAFKSNEVPEQSFDSKEAAPLRRSHGLRTLRDPMLRNSSSQSFGSSQFCLSSSEVKCIDSHGFVEVGSRSSLG